MALPAPNSPAAICNIALSLLNQAPIANIDQPSTPNEELCKTFYAQERRALLRGHSWNFAIKRAELASDAQAPLFGFSEQYTLPADFLRFLTRHDELGGVLISEPSEGVDYQLEESNCRLDNIMLLFQSARAFH